MPLYEYKAVTRKGNSITGTYETYEKSDVISMLRDKGYYPVQIKRLQKRDRPIVSRGMPRKMPVKALMVFCRQFSTVINAGVPILTGLDILRKQTENARLRHALDSLYEEVQKGKSLSGVMGMHEDVFPEIFVSMVMAGETSGTLGRVLERMAVHYEKEYSIKQKVKNALIYPSLIGIVALMVIIFLVVAVLPVFASMFQQMGAELPFLTKLLIGFSYVVRKYFALIIPGLIGFLFFIGWYFNTVQGKRRFDALMLRAPLIGNTNKKMFAARFSRTLSTLISNGIPLLQALEITGSVVDNATLQEDIERVKGDIEQGEGLAGPLKRIKDFPPMLACMAEVGENTGTLGHTLEKVADFYDQETENAMKRMTVLIEPVIIIVMAIAVAFIVLAVIIPMIDIMAWTDF